MLTVYFKPTNFCNVGCTHCYIPAEILADKKKMDLPMVRKTAFFIKEMMEKQREKNVHIIWHGGEPLTLNPDYFSAVGAIFDEVLPNHTEGLQTSLIPFTDKYFDIVKTRFGGEIGTSIDFNARSFNGSPQKYQEFWLKKVGLAKEQKFNVVPLITPTKHDLGNEKWIVEWLYENFPVFHMERYNTYKEIMPDWQNNKEYSLFMIAIFNQVFEMIKENGHGPMIRQILAPIMGVLYEQPGDRWGGNCQSAFLVVEPNGSLNNCPDKANNEESMGLIEAGYTSFQNNPLRKKWIKIQAVGHRIDECMDCENNKWCKSGCPINPQKGHNAYGNEEDCSGYKIYINHIREFLKNENNLDLAKKYIAGDLMKDRGLNLETARMAN